MRNSNVLGRSLMICTLSVWMMFAGIPVAGGQSSSAPEDLIILTWSDYIVPEVIEEFEAKFHAHITLVYYETEEDKEERLVERGGTGYDLVISSGVPILHYIKRNWVAPLETELIPNLAHIESRWRQARPELENYAVPYLWGTIGIAYRQDLVQETVTSLKQLFEPDEALRGKIIMIKDAYDSIGMALKYLGHSLNSEEKAHYDEVERLLSAQKPYVKEYGYISATEESTLISGEAWMALVYNGDGLVLQEFHPDIAFAVPQEGTGLWVDYLVVMQASPHKELAMKFINFLHEPQNAAQLSLFTMFATPNTAAGQFLPPEHLQNPMIYPSQDVLKQSEFPRILSLRTQKRRNAIFSKILQ